MKTGIIMSANKIESASTDKKCLKGSDNLIILSELDNISDGWWHWNVLENIFKILVKLKSTLGYHAHELIANIYTWESMLYAEDKVLAQTHLAHIDKYTPTILQELRFKHKNNNIIWILCRIVLLRDTHTSRQLLCIHNNISHLKKTTDELYFMAHHDYLTNLPNRANFMSILAKSIAKSSQTNKKFALFYIDIDNFKAINDRYGHAFGDAFLCEISCKLRSLTRKCDIISRLSGDEFALIIQDIKSIDIITEIARRYIRAFSAELNVQGIKIRSSVSIGIAIFPESAKTPSSLLECADHAMYHVKRCTKNNFYFFDASLDYDPNFQMLNTNSIEDA